jgi:hypothetical protein
MVPTKLMMDEVKKNALGEKVSQKVIFFDVLKKILCIIFLKDWEFFYALENE